MQKQHKVIDTFVFIFKGATYIFIIIIIIIKNSGILAPRKEKYKCLLCVMISSDI